MWSLKNKIENTHTHTEQIDSCQRGVGLRGWKTKVMGLKKLIDTDNSVVITRQKGDK